MAFPATRMRRLRATPALRGLVRETALRADRLVAPLFVSETATAREPVEAMPGVYRLPVAEVVREAQELATLGIGAVMLFGVPARKDAEGSGAWDDEGSVQLAVRAIKRAAPGLVVITDVCLCEYTDHGHCGVIDTSAGSGQVDNDATVELLARTAASHARAGADMVAPSDMMDGRVGAIRAELDEEGFSEVPILAYAAKFASAFYGPFRQAAASTPSFGDRRSYQMDPGNGREAVREALLDAAEGADALMVKPAMPYLDVIARVRDASPLPLAAYQVSGEYAMLEAAAAAGALDRRTAILESLTAIRRAGADLVMTYWASEAAEWLT
jgi:porphobilinogen synthase